MICSIDKITALFLEADQLRVVKGSVVYSQLPWTMSQMWPTCD